MNVIGVVHPNIDSLARAWLDQAETPLAIIDQNLRLCWLNRAAQIELDGKRVLESKDDILTAVDVTWQARLQQFVRTVTRTLSTWSLPYGGEHMLLRGIEIHRDHLNRYIGLWFFGTATFTPVYADLARAFDLTGREHEILLALMDAQRPEDIAKDLGLRIPTVRTHIRNLYDKLDVTCREQLFRRVSPFRLL